MNNAPFGKQNFTGILLLIAVTAAGCGPLPVITQGELGSLPRSPAGPTIFIDPVADYRPDPSKIGPYESSNVADMADVYGGLQWQLARTLSESGYSVSPTKEADYTLTIELIRLDLILRLSELPPAPPVFSEFILGFWIIMNDLRHPDREWRRFFYFHNKRQFKFDIMGMREQALRLIDDNFHEAAIAVVKDPRFHAK